MVTMAVHKHQLSYTHMFMQGTQAYFSIMGVPLPTSV